jgi:hypothetical protein
MNQTGLLSGVPFFRTSMSGEEVTRLYQIKKREKEMESLLAHGNHE